MQKKIRNLIKITVLSSEPRLEHGTQQQAKTKDGHLLWSVDIRTKEFVEKHQEETSIISTHKSIVDLQEGEQIVELKVTSMASGDGNFKMVKQFQTIVRAIDKNLKLCDFFSMDSLMTTLKNSQKQSAKSVTQ